MPKPVAKSSAAKAARAKSAASKKGPAVAASKTKPMYLHRAAGAEPRLGPRAYDAKFKLTPAYHASLPDMMEAEDAIQGAPVAIQQVGVSNFKLPLKYRARDGRIHTLETSVDGTVSLDASLKGINMSRIVRSFYEHRDDVVAAGAQGGGPGRARGADHRAAQLGVRQLRHALQGLRASSRRRAATCC